MGEEVGGGHWARKVVLNTTVRIEYIVQSEFCIHLFTVTTSIHLISRKHDGVHSLRLGTLCAMVNFRPIILYDINES